MSASKSQPSVLWLQVRSLAAVQAAITLTWVIYTAYLPELLNGFGFPKELAVVLLIIENALAAVMEPLMGGLSDRARRWMGSRFPFISAGVILSSALYIAIPAVFIFGNSIEMMRWVFLGVIVAWALAMTMFRSPAISLLGRYANPAQLPLAASLLTLTGGVVGAFKPFANQLVLSWGPGITFTVGSFVLLGAAAVLRAVHPPETRTAAATDDKRLSLPALGLILGTGASVAWGSRFLMDVIQKMLQTQMPNANIQGVMFAIALALAFAALPAGALAVRLRNRRAILMGLGVTVALLLLMVFIPVRAIVEIAVIGLIASFSLVVNSTVPFALSLVPPHRAGLGVGMYFGGFAAGTSLFGILFSQLASITPLIGAIVGAIAFITAALCIAVSTKVQRTAEVEVG